MDLKQMLSNFSKDSKEGMDVYLQGFQRRTRYSGNNKGKGLNNNGKGGKNQVGQ